jgi:TDG/mug DNA glycosylase family protein
MRLRFNDAIIRGMSDEKATSTTSQKPKPTKEQLAAAVGKTVPDIIAPNLQVLFCGINPSVYSAVVGHHFARPGNRFWPTLYKGGFTPRLLKPEDEQELLTYRYGITNIVERATVAAADLSADELASGGQWLRKKVEQYQPKVLAVLGISAYRLAFSEPRAILGKQPATIAATQVFVLPNPSGLNAHYTPADLARVFGEFRQRIEAISTHSHN